MLRFGRCSVRASDVGGQYYCEKKVEMGYLYGEVESETKNQGTEAHESLLEGAEPVDQEELWKAVYSNKPVLAMEWLLLAEYNDIVLAGQPDSVLFEDGFPLVVFEYKFSRSKRAYPSYHVQAGFYGLLLKNLGFDTGRLFYAIVVADHNARNNPNLRIYCFFTYFNKPALMIDWMPYKPACSTDLRGVGWHSLLFNCHAMHRFTKILFSFLESSF